MADALDVLATYPITHLNGYLITWYTRQFSLCLSFAISPLRHESQSYNSCTFYILYFIYICTTKASHRQSMLYPRLPFYIIYYYVVVPSTKYSILFQVVNITQSQFPLVLFVFILFISIFLTIYSYHENL